MEPSNNSRVKFWLGMAVSVGCLLVIFIFIKPSDIIRAFQNTNIFVLGYTALGILIFLCLRALRWRFLLDNQIRYQSVFHIQSIGYLLNMYLPGRLGDLTRAILIGSVPPITISRGLSTMVVERLLDMMFVVVLLPFTLVTVETVPAGVRQTVFAIGVLALIGIIVLIAAANFKRPLLRLVTNIFDRIPKLDTNIWVHRVDDLLLGLDTFTRPKDTIILLALSILVWVPNIFAYQMGMKAVGLDVTLTMAAFVICAAALSIAAPSSPGGVGVFQAGVIAAMQVLGLPEAQSASFAFAYHILLYLIVTVLGFMGLVATGSTIGNVWLTTKNYLKTRQAAS